MTLTKRQIIQFRSLILTWWKSHRRDLPWRHTHDPYKIALSEIMLQQTQVSRVLQKYHDFLNKFPTVTILAQASVADVLREWKGMGYNRRALYLREMAKEIVDRYGGKFPEDEKLLTKLSGLGTYTARAILVFAYRKNTSCVDTNIRKIIMHFFFNDKPQSPKIIQDLADRLVPQGQSWEWHQALMDYGALELRKLMPKRANRKRAIPFHSTNRFYRGRIIDLLRVKSYTVDALTEKIHARFDKSREEVKIIIDDLIKDGLVTRKQALLQLPK